MVIRINRAPVLTLWATIVAQQLGHERALALTLGRSIRGRAAAVKAKRLGIEEDRDSSAKDRTREFGAIDFPNGLAVRKSGAYRLTRSFRPGSHCR